MTDAVVTLKKGEGRYLQKGGPWIYDNEIADISPGAEDGGLVRVCGENGWPLGQGFLNRRSKLTVRMLTRDPDAEINEDFFLMRLKNAWEYRKKVVDTSSCRLVSGRRTSCRGWWWTSSPTCWWWSPWLWASTASRSPSWSC